MEHRKFSDDFKRDAVLKATAAGASKSSIAKDLGVSNNLLHRWIRKLTGSPTFKAMPGTRPVLTVPAASKAASTPVLAESVAAAAEAADATAQQPAKTQIGRPLGSRNKRKLVRVGRSALQSAPAAQSATEVAEQAKPAVKAQPTPAKRRQRRTAASRPSGAQAIAAMEKSAPASDTSPLRKKLQSARAERDVLKKLLAYYANI